MKTLVIAKGLHPPWATGEVSYARSVLASLLENEENDVTLVSTIDAHRQERINHTDMRNFGPTLKRTSAKYSSMTSKMFATNPMKALEEIGINNGFDSVHVIFPNLLPGKVKGVVKDRNIIKYIYVPAPTFARGLATSAFYNLACMRNRRLKVAFTSKYSARTYHFRLMNNKLLVPPAIDVNVYRNHNEKKNSDSILEILNKARYKAGLENLQNCEYVVLYMGWLVHERFPYDIILPAFQHLLKVFNRKVCFLVIGRESESFYNEEGNANQIIRYAKDIGISDRLAVVLRELNELEKVSVLNFSDTIFLPFFNARFDPPIIDPPMILLEAMACEKPVVVSKVLSIPAIIETEVNGHLLESLDKLEISKKIRSSLEANGVGKQARQSIINNFSIRNVSSLLQKMTVG